MYNRFDKLRYCNIREPLFVDSSESKSWEYFKDMRHLESEHFVVCLLNTKNKLTYWETVSIGDQTKVHVGMTPVFRTAVRNNAVSIVVLHNHPSGNPSPSQEDLVFHDRLTECGELLGIRILDGLIIGKDTYYATSEKKILKWS